MSLQRLVRPPIYSGQKRPSFAAAYARAARRYKFNVGVFPIYAYKNNAVFHVHDLDNIENGTEVPAESIQNDLEYVVPVKIGTPGVTLHLDFDTGSSDMWIWSSELANATHYAGHTIYNPANSSTAKQATGTWSISYGDGSGASGDVHTDTVTLGDLVIPNQSIELAKTLSPTFLTNGGNDGLLGLAWPELNTVRPHPVATPMENMLNLNLLELPVFTCKLDRGDNAGYYSFGYIDPNATSNPITYTPVDHSKGFWQTSSQSYELNGKAIKRPGNTCILDTGTTLALVDDTVLSHIYGAIPGATFDTRQGGWKYPESATVPELAFAVGNTLYKVNPQDFGYGSAGNGYIFGGVQSRGDLTFDILGDVFLKSVYVVFNQAEATVGLAQRDD